MPRRWSVISSGMDAEKPDHRHRLLLRARRERPRRRRAAEQRDELAALHWITSSARASSMRDVQAERLGGLEVAFRDQHVRGPLGSVLNKDSNAI